MTCLFLGSPKEENKKHPKSIIILAMINLGGGTSLHWVSGELHPREVSPFITSCGFG